MMDDEKLIWMLEETIEVCEKQLDDLRETAKHEGLDAHLRLHKDGSNIMLGILTTRTLAIHNLIELRKNPDVPYKERWYPDGFKNRRPTPPPPPRLGW